MTQNVAGIRELVGSDVNLAHRLMKNHLAEATGWKAYALFTAAALERLGVQPEGMHPQVETYEHLGEVQTYSLDLRPRYQALVDARRVEVTPEQAYVVTARDYPAPPPLVWDWLNDADKRARWAPEQNLKFTPTFLPGGRTGKGAQTHCIHGKKLFMVETVVDWRPFEYFTVDMEFPGMPMFEQATYRLTATPEGGTHLVVRERGRTTGVEWLDQPLYQFMFTKVNPTIKVLDTLARLIEEEQAQRAAVVEGE
jgi:uncharacterized protein YndB with AHSA1/START domain